MWLFPSGFFALLCRSLAPLVPHSQPNTACLVDRRDLLTWTADEIGERLRKGKLSVEDVVNATIQRINEDNEDGLKLRAIISLAPRKKLRKRARQLDRELANSKPRGPLHGIPIVIKVCLYDFTVNSLIELLIDDSWAGLLCHPSRSGHDHQRRKLCIIKSETYQKCSYR